MFKHYMERDLYINYNVFLPQKRSNITVHMLEYCRKSGFIGKPKNDTGSTSGHGGGHSQGTNRERRHGGEQHYGTEWGRGYGGYGYHGNY
uniref:Uncharacterized protein n=1 Tax=Meloidogyne javanica TaxID=6303 RepID=A0A915MHY0_MELJA